MEANKRLRGPMRARITRTINEAEVEMTNAQPNLDVLREKLMKLEQVMPDLSKLDRKVMNGMIEANCTDEEQADEDQVVEDYEDKVRRTTLQINKLLYPVPVRPASPTPSESSFATPGSFSVSTDDVQRHRFKLPKPEMKKFDGNLKEWLGFWAQFQKIDSDDSMDAADKFHYLAQGMVPGTEPYKIVHTFPQSVANYPKARDALKKRYGDESLLIQVYVRELLGLAIHNLTSKEKMSIADLCILLKSHLNSLESLHLDTADPSTWLFPLVESSLPVDTLKAWHRSPLSKKDGKAENPPKSSLDFLMEFVDAEVEDDQRIELATKGFRDMSAAGEKKPGRNENRREKSSRDKNDIPTASGLFSGQSNVCIFCDKAHASAECFTAQKMSHQEKLDKISGKKACFTCLRVGHISQKCKVHVSCIVCHKKHQTIMCTDLSKKGESKNEQKKEIAPTAHSNMCSSGENMLPTLLATLVHDGRRRTVRVLCDTGATHSYIKRDTAKELNLTPTGSIQYQHSIFGGRNYVEKHSKYVIRLERMDAGVKGGAEFEVLCQEKICSEIPRMPRGRWMTELKKKNIWISDAGKENESEVEVLVGASVFAKIYKGNSYTLKNGLVAMETHLGWTLFGREGSSSDTSVKTLISMFVGSSEIPVSKLWDLDTIGIMDPVEHKTKLEVEEETKQHFLKSVSREKDGRYSVKLPWIEGAPDLPDNRSVAEKRLISSSRKLSEKGQFQMYSDMFHSWLEEGIIERVKPEVTGGHFIPHRPVFKLSSTTTPVRPVFDASCKIKGFPSLNDCLQKGPNLMELIPSILLRFRENKIGVISDIRKAFLMVGMDEEDRNFLKFLWWEDESQENIIEYRHRRVVFGVNSSPFLLAAVLEYHLKNVGPGDREAAEKLWKSMYVDNCVTSVNSMKDYEEFRGIATRVLADAKMDLRDWEFGPLQTQVTWIDSVDPMHPQMEGIDSVDPMHPQMEGIDSVDPMHSPVKGIESVDPMHSEIDGGESLDPKCISSVLGLKWSKNGDTLSIDLDLPNIPEKITKRSILSEVHKVFDPIGFTAPVLLQPKLILQDVWAKEVTWEEEVNEDTAQRFKSWVAELVLLKKVKIPRHINPVMAEEEGLSVHTFCDASRDAYAAVIFVRAQSSLGTSVRLLQVKTRVAPLNRTRNKEGVKTEKRLTIPRLELLAATIGARLAHTTMQALEWKAVPSYFWSDSTTVIAWIQRNEMWGTFAGNRVREILKLTKAGEWSHVPGKLNPADLPSRGCSAAQYVGSRWWEGPDWLYGPQEYWPKFNPEDVDEEEVAAEKRKTAQVMTVQSKLPLFVPRLSSYKKNVSAMGWFLRAVHNFKSPPAKRIISRFLTVPELRSAEQEVLKFIQNDAFPNGAKDISSVKVVEENGLLKVKSKLIYRVDSADFRSPVVLPQKHPLVTQLIQYVHKSHCHGGTQVTLNALREKYWILQSRRIVSKVIRGCTRCFRYATKSLTVEPAPLPIHRVETVEAFENSGVDLAGPLPLKNGSKCWIVLFTCAVYRAVHLDLVQSLSTEAFIGSLERFININGRPAVLYSDNGTNFVGTANLFKKIDWKKVEEDCQVKKIQWVFNPPTAAWWGGWWERLVRSVKDLLRKMLGRAQLSYDELRTCLSGVEATINSRPLTTITEDVGDLVPLTPMMFTRTILSTKFPEAKKITSQVLQKRFKIVQELKKDLQARFRKEYLSLLVQKAAERKTKPPEVGDVVLVGSDDRKRFEWPLGRIVELLPGKDSHVRTARVLIAPNKSGRDKMPTKTRILVRPLQRLYPLEVRRAEEVPQLTEVKKPRVEKDEESVPMVRDSQKKEVTTRSGRKITRPRRYGQWNGE